MGNQGTRTFGAYELVRAIGVGGMAETYVATRRGPGDFEQQVCLKRILPAFERDETFIKMFLEEARLAARLRHTNIVQVIDFGVEQGSHYLALELVDGLDLKELLRELKRRHETLSSGLVALIAIELAAALDFAHTGGRAGSSVPIVHRDLSPSNVLVSYAGEVKLTDFGIAKALKSTTLNLTQTVKGKVPYMAPEYALEGRYDRRSDLFALGVLLYEALAGERPYKGSSDIEIVRNVSEGNRHKLAELCPTAPPLFVKAIEKLIDPVPDNRFATANDFLDALLDVSPSPTARRALGMLALSIRPHNPTPADTTRSDQPTMRLGSTTQPDPPGKAFQSAESSPNAETRTHTPDEGPVDDHRSDAPTRIDEGQAQALELAAASTRAINVHRAKEATVAPTRAQPESFDNTRVPPAANVASTQPESKRKAPAPLLWLTSALIACAAVGAVYWYPRETTQTQTRTQDQTQTRTQDQTQTRTQDQTQTRTQTQNRSPSPNPSPSPSPSPNPSPSPSPIANSIPTAPARLHVVIIPFGDVWVDGELRGRSPARIPLTPGTHRISTGPNSPEQTVRLRSGESRSIEIRTAAASSH